MSDVTTMSVVRYTLVKNGGVVQTLTAGGAGVAAGGSVGQVPVKTGAGNYATGWAAQSTLAAGTAATLATPRNIDGQSFNGSADITVVAPATHAATSKATPVDADELPLADSAAAWGLKKLTWANLKATLKVYLDTLYQPLAAALSSWAGVTRAAGFDTFAATPSSANLRALLTDETGTGAAVFADSPTFTTGINTPKVQSGVGGSVEFDINTYFNGDAHYFRDLLGTNKWYMTAAAGWALLPGTATADLGASWNPVRIGYFGTSIETPAVKFPATQVPSADPNAMDDYREASYTATATGMTTSPTTTARAVKTGNEVTIDFDANVSGTSNATAFTLTGMPTNFRPARTKTVLVLAQDNGGAFAVASCDIGIDGVMTIYKDPNGGAFTAAGTKGFGRISITYTIS